MAKCLVVYCRSHPHDVQVLFDLLTVFLAPSLVDFSFLQDFYRDEVAVRWEPRHKRAALVLFLRVLADQGVTMDLKVHALELLVTPMLAATFADPALRNADVVDGDIVAHLMRTALDVAALPRYSEALRIELLKLATLLIEHVSEQLVEHRKELIKFAWNHLKSEDTQSKQCAYVNVCRFIQVYDTPPKIILQVPRR